MRLGTLGSAVVIVVGLSSTVVMSDVETGDRSGTNWALTDASQGERTVGLMAETDRLLPRSFEAQVGRGAPGGVTIILTPAQQRILLSSSGAALGAAIGAAACSAGGPAAAACAAGGAFLAVATAEAIKEYGVREGCNVFVTFSAGRNPTVTNVSRVCGGKIWNRGNYPKAVAVR